MKPNILLNKLTNHETLTFDEAKSALISISNNEFNASQIAAFLTIYAVRNCTINELAGFREALLDLCVTIDFSDYETIDLCGTGGDGKDTFNISTLAAFVVAGTGIKVAKHGNYGVSSISGSSNVLETLGIQFTNNESVLKHTLEKANITILHAPLFHPAMKNVAPIRKELGIKTFFNMLGPMVNPSFPKHQMIGVFNLELARMYAYLYQNTKTNYAILHDLAGYDEVSLTNQTKIITIDKDSLIDANTFKVNKLQETDILGGKTVIESAAIFENILKGNGTIAQNNVVCANAGIAISLVKNISVEEGFALAKESLLSKNALEKFTILKSL